MREWKRVLFAAISSAGLFLLLFLALKWHPLVALALSAGLYGGVYLLLAPKAKEQTLRMTYGVDEEEYQGYWRKPAKTWLCWPRRRKLWTAPRIGTRSAGCGPLAAAW